ncbi:reverse transcriptase [Candidatus Saccharibacteria bacterium]|nr:reverse transcriptase [Candidatus Saccharibacteria bacterium]
MFSFVNDKLCHDLLRAYKEAARHKRSTVDEYKFEMYLFENLKRLEQAINTREYTPGKSIVFICFKPVVREIFAANFADRVTHHLLAQYVEQFIDRQLIYDSYSCRKNKGTDEAILRIYGMARKLSNNFQEDILVFKGDFANYFYSLDRQELVKSAMRMLNRQSRRGLITTEEYGIADFLWHQILLDDPCKKAIRRGKKSDWNYLPQHKSLFNQPEGVGLPIGNYSSQMISNIYTNDFDRFVTMHLGYKCYGRYVDDFIVLARMDQRTQLLRDIELMKDYLAGMKLKMNPKKCSLQPFSRGIPFLGVRLAPYHIIPDQRLVKNFRKNARAVAQNGSEADLAGLVSYLGRLKCYNARRLEQAVFESLGWEYQFSDYELMVNGLRRKRRKQK